MNNMNPHPHHHGGPASMYQMPGSGPYSGAPYFQSPYFHPMAYPAYPVHAHYGQQHQEGFFNDRFLKGIVIGAAAAYVLTNESIQRTAIKSVVKVWTLMQGGVEELKERFQDAEAEIRAQTTEHE